MSSGRAPERSCARHSANLEPSLRSDWRVLDGTPATALEQFSHDVDLLVCGSRGYGPIGSVLLGGVSRRLVHHAACPGDRHRARNRAGARGLAEPAHEGRACLSAAPPEGCPPAAARMSSSRAAAWRRSRRCSPCAISSANRWRSRCSRPSPASSTVPRRSPSRSASAAPPRWTSRRWRATRTRSCVAERCIPFFPHAGPSCSAAAGELSYDILVVAVGAGPAPPCRAPSASRDPRQTSEVAAILDRIERGELRAARLRRPGRRRHGRCRSTSSP